MANCRKYNINKYKKVATTGWRILPNGSIVTENWIVDNRKNKKKRRLQHGNQ